MTFQCFSLIFIVCNGEIIANKMASVYIMLELWFQSWFPW